MAAPPDRYVGFAPGVSYRGLETPCLFHVERDELYELEPDGERFIEEVEAGVPADQLASPEILEFALGEGLVVRRDRPAPGKLARSVAPRPSLRYLELLVTLRCNLRCRHCYLGEPRGEDMPAAVLEKTIADFDQLQGLRLLISGGEPLLYPRLDRLADLIAGRGFRSVLLTNGLALTAETLRRLPVHEVQVSIDGLEAGHDAVRGAGTFARALAAARTVRDQGMDLSVATMVHADNLEEMDGLEALCRELGAREWSLDVPLELGRWPAAIERAVPLDLAAAAMARGYGGSYHGSAAGHACGAHLAAVTPGGDLIPCGLYPDLRLGRVTDGLAAAWANKKPVPLAEVETCGACPVADDCSGGCRRRARPGGPDPVMCAAHGWPMGRGEDER